jgi:hypothetical protein
MARRPWVLESYSAAETARLLIMQAGSAQAARDAITKANREQVATRTKWATEAAHDLLLADAIRRSDKCSDDAALKRLAAIRARTEAAADAMVRRLRRRLSGKTLSQFARTQPMRAMRNGPNEFGFELRR